MMMAVHLTANDQPVRDMRRVWARRVVTGLASGARS
jgi:hypothetical protein